MSVRQKIDTDRVFRGNYRTTTNGTKEEGMSRTLTLWCKRVVAAGAAIVLGAAAPPFPSSFPPSVPPATISGTVPYAVPLPADIQTPLQIRPNFDYFSWQSFIALNWPALPGQRGVPNQPDNPSVFLTAKQGTPVVWGTYKDSFDLFGQGTTPASPWNSDQSQNPPCGPVPAGQRALIFSTMSDTPVMGAAATKQAFSFPLVDQRGNYVYYDVRYDKAQYEFIANNGYYLLKNLAPAENAQFGLQMPMTTASPNVLGSIMVKAAWRVATGREDLSRFYATKALVYNPVSKKCSPQTVLLVGLHIAHKVARSPPGSGRRSSRWTTSRPMPMSRPNPRCPRADIRSTTAKRPRRPTEATITARPTRRSPIRPPCRSPGSMPFRTHLPGRRRGTSTPITEIC
jgi:hypothetical protein